jgi:hypothetical protein
MQLSLEVKVDYRLDVSTRIAALRAKWICAATVVSPAAV